MDGSRLALPRRHPSAGRALRLPALLLALAVLGTAPARSVAIRVRGDAPGPVHDGASWNTAFLTIQAGIDATAPAMGDVWVAAGTYNERVVLPLGTRLLGGFAATETSDAERNPSVNVTTIDAEGLGPAIRVVSAYPVGPEAVIDGFRIVHGVPAGVRSDTGEGTTIVRGSLIRDCQAGVILMNRAVIASNTIHANVTDGISLAAGSSISVVQDNTITDNGLHGIRDGMSSTIAGNTISGNGGNGIEGLGVSTVTNCAIRLNQIGVHASDGSGPGTTVSHCVIAENGAAGIWADQESCMDVIANVVAMNKGIGIEHTNRGTVRDNLVRGNSDGMRVHDPTAVIGNTIVANVGLGLDIVAAGGPVVNNVVALNNSGVRVGAQDPQWPLDFRHNNVFGNPSYNLAIGPVQDITDGNVSADPLFVDAAGGNFRLTPASPCHDAGDDAAAAGPRDLDGRPRTADTHVDMGAYEYNEAVDVIRVSAGAPGPVFDGASWATAFQSLGDAVSSAARADEIWVALGTYPHPLTLNALSLYGGFAGTETAREERDWAHNVSLIKESVTLAGLGGLVDGFSIIGDVTCNAATLKLSNTYLRGSLSSGPMSEIDVTTCRLLGGGISAPLASRLYVTNTEITDTPGRGISAYGDIAVRLLGNRLQRCHGGGIYLHSPDQTIVATNTIQDCQAADGAGIWCGGANVNAYDNLITNNQASGRGGGVFLATGTFSLANNTIVSNTAGGGGGGIALATEAPIGPGTLANNIVAFNSSGILKAAGPDPLLSHNDVFGSTSDDFSGLPDPGGTDGHISADPVFVNRQQRNFHLASASPCVNTGANAFAIGRVDYDGDPRICEGTVDIGADELMAAGYTAPDILRALRIAAGLDPARAGDLVRLDVETSGASAGKVTLEDAASLIRKGAMR